MCPLFWGSIGDRRRATVDPPRRLLGERGFSCCGRSDGGDAGQHGARREALAGGDDDLLQHAGMGRGNVHQRVQP